MVTMAAVRRICERSESSLKVKTASSPAKTCTGKKMMSLWLEKETNITVAMCAMNAVLESVKMRNTMGTITKGMA